MERILSVHTVTVKLVGPGLSSIGPYHHREEERQEEKDCDSDM